MATYYLIATGTGQLCSNCYRCSTSLWRTYSKHGPHQPDPADKTFIRLEAQTYDEAIDEIEKYVSKVGGLTHENPYDKSKQHNFLDLTLLRVECLQPVKPILEERAQARERRLQEDMLRQAEAAAERRDREEYIRLKMKYEGDSPSEWPCTWAGIGYSAGECIHCHGCGWEGGCTNCGKVKETFLDKIKEKQ